MIAITTSNSIKVKPQVRAERWMTNHEREPRATSRRPVVWLERLPMSSRPSHLCSIANLVKCGRVRFEDSQVSVTGAGLRRTDRDERPCNRHCPLHLVGRR